MRGKSFHDSGMAWITMIEGHYKKSVYLQRISATHHALQKQSATHFALQNLRCKKQGCRFSATQVNAALQKSATQRPLQYRGICQQYDGKLQRIMRCRIFCNACKFVAKKANFVKDTVCNGRAQTVKRCRYICNARAQTVRRCR